MSKLLINEPPLIVLPSLATAIGVNEALIIQQIHYWLDPRINKNFKDGQFWVYNTYEEWQKQFPFWSIRTIRRIIQSLEEKNLLISKNFNTNSFDKTKWYSINYIVLNDYKPDNNPYGQNDHIDSSNSSVSFSPKLRLTNRSTCPVDEDNLTSSYIDTKITTKTTTKNSLSTKQNQHDLILVNRSNERENVMLKIWNDVIEKELGREINYTSNRGKLLNKRLKDFFNNDLSKWNEFCQKIVKSKFLMGERTDFRVQLDWVLEETNLVKVLEGSYNRKEEMIKQNKDEISTEQELIIEIQQSNTPEFWQQIMILMMKKKGIPTFKSWFIKNQYNGFKNGILEMKAFSKFGADWIVVHYFDDMVDICKQILPEFKELRIIS